MNNSEKLDSIKQLGKELNVRWFNKPITAKKAMDRANTLLNITEQLIETYEKEEKTNQEFADKKVNELVNQRNLTKMVSQLEELEADTEIA